MKKNILLAVSLLAAVTLTGCKSRESAYRQAWEKAMEQDKGQDTAEVPITDETENVVVTPVQTTPRETETTIVPVAPATPKEDNSDVREIKGDVSVVSGEALKTYSVVVGSFVTQANAEGLKSRLQSQGYDARVLKTNETINNVTGWYRVIASSYSDKASAVSSRNSLKSTYPGAWLLYRK